MKQFLIFVLAVTLSACFASNSIKNSPTTADLERLSAVVAAQSDEHKTRHAFRHPQETLAFFKIKPGMTVVEVLPGEGWYSSILAPYIGPEGTLIGVDYPLDMMKNFDWVTEEFLAKRVSWGNEWMAKASTWPGGAPAKLQAATLATLPESLNGTVDSVLFIRALHNLSRFEPKGGYRTSAFKRTYDLLKPGGTVGIVQHQVGEDRASSWADGSQGYLKKSDLITVMKNAGFEFVAESPINENPKDQPTEQESVWRLPPSFYTSQDDPALKAKYAAIGESNRMTLLFRKPK